MCYNFLTLLSEILLPPLSQPTFLYSYLKYVYVCGQPARSDAGLASSLNFFCRWTYMDSITRFFASIFFHQTDPPKTLIHGLKSFC
jgi:hypothetical protein